MKNLRTPHTSPIPQYILRGVIGKLAMLVMLSITLVACSSTGDSDMGGSTLRSNANNPASRILACKRGDSPVANQGQCLQDDAACYEIANGGWCTGPRGNICPAGSQALPAGSACPSGSRCFRIGESLECIVQLK